MDKFEKVLEEGLKELETALAENTQSLLDEAESNTDNAVKTKRYKLPIIGEVEKITITKQPKEKK